MCIRDRRNFVCPPKSLTTSLRMTLIRYTMICIYSRANVWKREKGYRVLRAGAQVQAGGRNAGRVVY